MALPSAVWQKRLVEAGLASIKNIRDELQDELHIYGYHHWYGSDPAWLQGKRATSRASAYEKAGVRSVEWKPPTTAQRALLAQYRSKKKGALAPDFIPRPKGCYGWVWANIRAAYLAADEAAKATLFEEIKPLSGTPFLVAKKSQTQGWKIVYYAADTRKLNPQEKRQMDRWGTYSCHKIRVDDSIVDFRQSAATFNAAAFTKLKTVDFWWGSESERYGPNLSEVYQGVHFFVGSRGKLIELEWNGNPNDKPQLIVESSVDSRLWHSGKQPTSPTSGILCMPPGTWS